MPLWALLCRGGDDAFLTKEMVDAVPFLRDSMLPRGLPCGGVGLMVHWELNTSRHMMNKSTNSEKDQGDTSQWLSIATAGGPNADGRARRGRPSIVRRQGV